MSNIAASLAALRGLENRQQLISCCVGRTAHEAAVLIVLEGHDYEGLKDFFSVVWREAYSKHVEEARANFASNRRRIDALLDEHGIDCVLSRCLLEAREYLVQVRLQEEAEALGNALLYL